MKLYTSDYETGTFIEECASIEEAKQLILGYEEEDKKDGTYEQGFYAIVDEERNTLWRNI